MFDLLLIPSGKEISLGKWRIWQAEKQGEKDKGGCGSLVTQRMKAGDIGLSTMSRLPQPSPEEAVGWGKRQVFILYSLVVPSLH